MLYPEPYNAQEVHRNMKFQLLYEGGITNGFNEETEEMLVYLMDEVADRYAKSTRMRIITRAEAGTWMTAARSLIDVPEEIVTDVDRMVAIQAKKAAGVTLTREDADAMDPDKAVRGINRKPKTIAGYFEA